MSLLSFEDITNGQQWIGLGIAGNQAGHLAQAGESDDFKDVLSTDDNTPKGLFPWYLPGADNFLGKTPLSSTELNLCANDPIQPEPEIALIVQFHYSGEGKALSSLEVRGFTVFNDCSRRIPAEKISMKKNWGEASQGMLDAIVPLNDFASIGGKIEQFRLGCYLIRDGELIEYGKSTSVSEYCYLNNQLSDWLVDQINNQKDHGPLETLSGIFTSLKPAYGVIGIGATCYTEFGNSEQRFLREGDEVIVTAYDARQYSKAQVEDLLKNGDEHKPSENLLILRQSVSNTRR